MNSEPVLLAIAAPAYSQTTFASVTGTVMDATGSVVPGATISVTNAGTGVKSTTKSNEAGNYTIAQAAPHASGRSSSIRPYLDLQVTPLYRKRRPSQRRVP